jgi:serine/threonine-protein kinase
MGEVWLGQRDDGQAEQRVALKRVRAGLPGFAERLRGERRILARLEHPNIARFIDAGVDEHGSPWLALEYVDGEPVTGWCERQRTGLSAMLVLFCKICAAVDEAHRQLIVHRDLKPDNVLVDARGEPKLLDFGVAQLIDDSQSNPTTSLMTPSYAAPEQLNGQPVSTSTDIYALGLLLFRMLTGQLPPGRRNAPVTAILQQVAGEQTCRPSAHVLPQHPYPGHLLRGDLDAIVAQALRHDPTQRYRSALDLADDLQRHLTSRPVRARPLTRRYRLGRFFRRNAAAASFASLAVAALLVGSVLALEQARHATEAAALAGREADAARRALVRAAQSNAFLESLFREQDPFARAGSRARSAAELLEEGVERVQTELAEDLEGQLGMLLSLAEAQLAQGLNAAAASTVDLAQQRWLALEQPAAPGVRLQMLYGRLAEAGLHLPEALSHMDRASSLAAIAHGLDSLVYARVLRETSRVKVSSGDFPAAFADASKAHALLMTHLGETHAETAIARYLMGLVREQKREDLAALEDFSAVVGIIERAHGDEHALLIRPLMSLGEVQRRLRQFEVGRATLRRGAAIAAARLGARHAQHASILIRLGTLERDAGDFAAAIAALEAAEIALAEDDVATLAQLLASRGAIHSMRGDPVAAEPDLRRAMELRHAGGGRSSGLAWYSQAEWAMALAQLGRLEEAEALLREARRELALMLGPQAYQNSLIAARLGNTLMLAGRPAEAIPELAEAERLVVAHAGPGNLNALQYRLQRAHALADLPERRAEALGLLASIRAETLDASDALAALESRGLSNLQTRLELELEFNTSR